MELTGTPFLTVKLLHFLMLTVMVLLFKQKVTAVQQYYCIPVPMMPEPQPAKISEEKLQRQQLNDTVSRNLSLCLFNFN